MQERHEEDGKIFFVFIDFFHDILHEYYGDYTPSLALVEFILWDYAYLFLVCNGGLTYQDKHIQLRRDDVIYYWIHFAFKNAIIISLISCIELLNFTITMALDIFPTRFTIWMDTFDQQQCTTTSVTWICKDDTRQKTCPRQLPFEDNFDNLENWNSVQRFAGMPDSEFIVYMTNNVTDISDGCLRIKSIVIDDKFGAGFVSRGSLILENCTGEIDTSS